MQSEHLDNMNLSDLIDLLVTKTNQLLEIMERKSPDDADAVRSHMREVELIQLVIKSKQDYPN